MTGDKNPISAEADRRIGNLERDTISLRQELQSIKTDQAVVTIQLQHLADCIDSMVKQNEETRKENRDSFRKLLYPMIALVAGAILNFILAGGLKLP